MINFNEFSLQVWPGVVRIHQGYDAEEQQTIELTVRQIKSFIEALTTASDDATLLGLEVEKMERENRTKKALKAATKAAE